MFSDIVVNINKAPWGLAINDATGRYAQRELTNQQLILLAIMVYLFGPRGESAAKQLDWAINYFDTWCGRENAMSYALDCISARTLERYLERAGHAKVVRKNGKEEYLADYLSRNEVAAKKAFPPFCLDVQEANYWVAGAVGFTLSAPAPEPEGDEATNLAPVVQEEVRTLASDESATLAPGESVAVPVENNETVVVTNTAEESIIVAASGASELSPLPEAKRFEYESTNGLGSDTDREAVPYSTPVWQRMPEKKEGFFSKLGRFLTGNF
jgi:hypothetical protein